MSPLAISPSAAALLEAPLGSWPAFVAAAGAALVALFVLAELGARTWLRVRDQWFVHQPYIRRRFHIATDVIPSLPEVSIFSANADGERGEPVPRNPERTLRVLVAGGSAAECYLLDQEDSWAMVTQRELERARMIERPVHVGNVARSLIPCRTIDALLQRVLPNIRSIDAIVLMVGASDMVGWFETKTPAEIDEGEEDLTRHCDEHPQGPFGWAPKATAIYRLFRRLNMRLRRPVDVRANAGASIAKHRAMRANAATMLDEVPDPRPMLDGFEKHLTALIATCKRHAPRVIVARQPWLDRDFTPEEEAQLWNFGQGSPYRGKLDTYYSTRVVRHLMERIDEVAARVAEATGAEAIDLRAVVPSDFDHYYDFLHHTPLGNRRVGEAVARQVARPDLSGAAHRAPGESGGGSPDMPPADEGTARTMGEAS